MKMHKSYLATWELIYNFSIQNAGIFIKFIHSALIDDMNFLLKNKFTYWWSVNNSINFTQVHSTFLFLNVLANRNFIFFLFFEGW